VRLFFNAGFADRLWDFVIAENRGKNPATSFPAKRVSTSTSPNPLQTITGTSGRIPRIRSSVSRPSIPGNATSSSTSPMPLGLSWNRLFDHQAM
jgi:hypothetical protein